jgi:6-phosphogluconolactonase (cycloisomerase 2 family)
MPYLRTWLLILCSILLSGGSVLHAQVGRLTYQRAYTALGDNLPIRFPYGAVISPDGRQMLVLNMSAPNVTIFHRNPEDGSLQLDSTLDVPNCGYHDTAIPLFDKTGRHLYLPGGDSNWLHVLLRDTITGALTLTESYGNNGGVYDLVMSPDERHIYVTGSGGSGQFISGFARNIETGRLEPLALPEPQIPGLERMWSTTGVTMSSDGRHVYVAGVLTNMIAVFERNVLTGQLTYVTRYEEGNDGVAYFRNTQTIRVHSNGEYVYVAHDGPELGEIGGWGGGTVESRPDQVFINHSPGGGITVFRRDPVTGRLQYQESLTYSEDHPTLNYVKALTITSDGSSLYVAGRNSSAVTVFHSADGDLQYMERWIDREEGVDGLFAARALVTSPDGGHLYVVGGYDEGIAHFTVETGGVTQTAPLVDFDVQSGDRHDTFLFDASGTTDREQGTTGLMYRWDWDNNDVWDTDFSTEPVIYYQFQSPGEYIVRLMVQDQDELWSTARDTVLVTAVYGTSDALLGVEYLREGDGDISGISYARDLAVSPDGRFLYITSKYDAPDNQDTARVTIFARDRHSGRLSYTHHYNSMQSEYLYLRYASDLFIPPDGQFLYIYVDGGIAMFKRNMTSGQLTHIGTINTETEGFNLSYISEMACSPDGRHLYLAIGGDGGGLAIMKRDLESGVLMAVNFHLWWDITDNFDLLRSKTVIVSPDGRHVYLGATMGDAVGVFQRNPDTGDVTLDHTISNWRDSNYGLDNVTSIRLSPDGEYLYIAAEHDNAVSVYRRDVETGRLSPVAMYQDGVGGVEGLARPKSLRLSSDGTSLYVLGAKDHEIAIFNRHSQTGELQFAGHILTAPSAGGNQWYSNYTPLHISPDDRHIYLINGVDRVMSIFARIGDRVSAEEDLEQLSEIPETFHLLPNYPNPFNPDTRIPFTVQQTGWGRLDVFDTLGRRVATLLQGPVGPGEYRLHWDSTDEHGRPVSSGVYFYRLELDQMYVKTRRMLLLR